MGNDEKAGEMNRRVVYHFARKEKQLFDGLELIHRPKPNASPGHAIVRLTMRPVPPLDTFGHFSFESVEELRVNGIVPGCEGCGVVDEIGEGVTKWKKGDRVVPIHLLSKHFFGKGEGAWQDFMEFEEDELLLIPDTVSDEWACQLSNVWSTYILLSEEFPVPPGEYILQTGASSALGRQMIQYAKHLGIKTINAVRMEEQKEELKALGADEVINISKEDLRAKVMEITGGKGVHCAFDIVGGEISQIVAACVKDECSYVVLGEYGGHYVTISLDELYRKVRVMFINTDDTEAVKKNLLQTTNIVWRLLEDKVIQPQVRKKFALTEYEAAITEAKKPSTGGKVIIEN
ncbi:hypothetical protein O6H91_21G041100 [Diphasiastrum complanatum]|uniref:Uncharacterized protein n=1 Tax=Diphasiastrum complanatum TaxID=34168 RepID=A0ACC2AJV1_DIPCM|nr:hypothetical protein O6H91_21G041100 [Diphasiastrum complanatum]